MEDTTTIPPAIEMNRRIVRKASDQFVQRGAERIDTALGTIYAAHDLAHASGMTPIEAIEWMRNAVDLMERQLMQAPERKH